MVSVVEYDVRWNQKEKEGRHKVLLVTDRIS